MALRTLLLVSIFVMSGCAKYKFDGASDNSKNLVPLSVAQENPELMDQYPCGKSGVSVECREAKVQICHVPPGNPQAAHTLCIGQSAVQAHVGHHIAETGEEDFLGKCEGNDSDSDSNSDDSDSNSDSDSDSNDSDSGGTGGATGGTTGATTGTTGT